ncbi:MAG: hypothetical protein KDH09_16180 [Chrysiogenetes bacterium]|nr:hypothetical protein [Chrysiogenetes bacterium]
MNRHNVILLATLALAALTGTGCSGSKYSMRLQSLRYPASMSGYLYDEDERMLSEKDMEVIGEFNEKTRLWAMAWGLATLNGESSDQELAELINAAVEKRGGEGVIDLGFSSETCGINFAPAISILPLWPGCTSIQASGTIVRRIAANAPSETPALPPKDDGSQVSARR